MTDGMFMPCDDWSEKLATSREDLTVSDRVALETHLASCPACSLTNIDDDMISKLIRDLPPPDFPSALPSRLLRLREETGKQEFQEPKERSAPSISVVIPALNEARNLRHVLPLIPSFVHEIILVDGYSTDDTIDLVEQLRPAIRAPIRIILQSGKGKGNALQNGFAASTGDIIVTLDADGSADPREIPLFVEALNRGNDFARGSRCIVGGGSHDFTLLRRLGNYGLRKLVNMLFRARFSDLCYGYNAFWRYCLDYIEVDCDGLEVETLIHLRACKANLKIVEVPSVEYRRIYGKSNLDVFRDGWRVLRTIVRERFTSDRSGKAVIRKVAEAKGSTTSSPSQPKVKIPEKPGPFLPEPSKVREWVSAS